MLAAKATPLPLEVHQAVRSHRPSRVVLALLNLAVVLYLPGDIHRVGSVAKQP